MIEKILYKIKKIVDFINYLYARHKKYLYTKRMLMNLDVNKHTMYPNEPRKCKSLIIKEILHLLQEQRDSWTPEMTVTQYFFCGCDRQSANIEDFVFQKEYDCARDSLNGELAPLYKYKNIVGSYLKSKGINASCSLGQISSDGQLITLNDGSIKNLIQWLKEYKNSVFCKPNDGNQGRSCYRIENTDSSHLFLVNGKKHSAEKIPSLLSNLIVEPLIIQSAELRNYSPNCVNPLRIRTMNINGDIKYVSTYISIGGLDAYYSNGASSGVMIGLDEKGQCITDGFCEVQGKEGRFSILPGTNIRIADILITGVKEAIELAKAAHRTTPQIFAIGWDVGITDNGPIIIEGNPQYGSCTYQAISGIGERQFFEREFKSRLK